MNDPKFAPGFRFSLFDAIILLAGFVATVGVGQFHALTGAAIGVVVLHFFFFCNVIRMARKLELIWAAAFSLMSALTVFELLSWLLALVVVLAVTIVLSLIELRKPSYHGIFWQQINPTLPQWWQQHGK